MLILNAGGILTTGFEKVLLMQNPLNSATSEVIDTYVYKIGIASQLPDYSFASAVGLFQSVITFSLTVLVNYISKRVSTNSLW
jgi:multiple sugar transport system permease protein/putative aldouronate transport system permease protein